MAFILNAMRLVPPPKLLLLLKEAQDAQSVAEILGPYDALVLLEGSSAEAVDVIVTDLALVEVALASGRAPSELTSPADSRTLGVVTLGGASWGDVALAADYSDRELRLACTLLCELMRTRRQRNESAALANIDALTGVPNRRAWDRMITEAARHSDGRWTLGIVDLDDFGRVNRAGGFAAGDESIVRIAQAMNRAMQPREFLARLGGDEFGVLLQSAGDTDIAATFERLRAAVAQSADAGATFTLSIGYVQASRGIVDPQQLVAAADRALREAKTAGGNRVVRGDVAASH